MNNSDDKAKTLVDEGRMLRVKDVLAMWPVSGKWLWEHTFNGPSEQRIPSYKFGKKRLYKYDELNYWRENRKQFHEVSAQEADSDKE